MEGLLGLELEGELCANRGVQCMRCVWVLLTVPFSTRMWMGWALEEACPARRGFV